MFSFTKFSSVLLIIKLLFRDIWDQTNKSIDLLHIPDGAPYNPISMSFPR